MESTKYCATTGIGGDTSTGPVSISPGLQGARGRLAKVYMHQILTDFCLQSIHFTSLTFHMSSPTAPNSALNRQNSDASQWTDAEKDEVMHLDQSRLPQTIVEEDEGGNVGFAAYERSKALGEIVRYVKSPGYGCTDLSDTRTKQEDSISNRPFPAPALSHHPDTTVSR